MNRRALVTSLLCAPFLTSCKFSFEQGFFGECRPGAADGAHSRLLASAWQDLRADRVWDVHVHLFGNGRSGSGIHVDPDFDRPRTPQGMARRAFFMNGGCVGDDDQKLDQGMVRRLAELVDRCPAGAKVMLLAFDFTYDERGVRQPEHTTFAVPNEYARRIAQAKPDRFEWIASVHPYREDAIAALEAAAGQGARAVKWLPPAMGIDPRDRRCIPYYDALRRLRLPLLVHLGEEQAVAGAERSDLANPLLIRNALDQGVRVVAAHCATMGESPDIEAVRDPAKAPQVENFELFARLMAERRYEGLLFGDISATPQLNRARYLPQILSREAWHGRLLNGSDYPLPGIMPLFSLNALVSLGLLPEALAAELKDLRQSNALLFDFAVKRQMSYRGRRFPRSVFETRDFFVGA